MNEFQVVDADGIVHFLITCMICHGLIERGNLDRHLDHCSKRAVRSWVYATPEVRPV